MKNQKLTEVMPIDEENHCLRSESPALLLQSSNHSSVMNKELITSKKTQSMHNKGKLFLKVIPFAVAGIFVFSTGQISAQDGEAIFKQKCSACHKLGGGRFVGPDLIGVTEKRSEDWLMKWTRSSAALIASGDKDANAIYKEYNGTAMPDQPLTDEEFKSLYGFIKSKSGGGEAATADTAKKAPPAPDASLTATTDQIEDGKNLFIGSNAFVNGGASCLSCHNINYEGVIPGGLLAKDLTSVHSRLGGDAGLTGILGAPPFPAMTQAYKDKPLTEKEISNLIAFLNKVDKDTANQTADTFNYLAYGGVAGMIGLLILIFGMWFVRKKNTVKKDIYDRQVKSI